MVNKCIIQGRLARDPEYQITKTDKSLCNFTVAWGERIGRFSTSLYLDCIAWGKNADMVAKYFIKGQEIIVVGKLFTNGWKDKKGKNHYVNKLTVEDVQFCGAKDEYDDWDAGENEQEEEPVF